MELIYAYVDDYAGILNNGYFSYSNKFRVSYDMDSRKLKVDRKEYIKNFFSNEIENISLLVGKNGAGKTTLLDLIGLKRDGIINNANSIQKKYKEEYKKIDLLRIKSEKLVDKNNWFLLYHIEREIFVIECNDIEIISNIDNLDERCCPVDCSIVVSISNGKIEFIKFLQLTEYKDKINIIYKNEPCRQGVFSYDRYINKREDYTVCFDRIYIKDFASRKNLYEFLSDKSMNECVDFDLEKVIINIKINGSYSTFKSEMEKIDDNRQLSLKNITTKGLSYKMQVIDRMLIDYINHIWINLIIPNDFYDFLKEEIYKIDRETIGQTRYLKEVLITISKNWIEHRKESVESFQFCNAIIEVAESMLIIEEEYFKKAGIVAPVTKTSIGLKKLLQLMDFYEDNERDFSNNIFDWIEMKVVGTSEGQATYLNLFSMVYNIRKNISNRCDCIILLLDEPDKSFHPEWARSFIHNIINFITKLESVIAKKENKKKYQLIMSTHSPFMISDVPRENIIFMGEKNSTSSRETFAANIHDVLSDEFFMNFTIGEFAKNKIQKIVKDMIDIKMKNDQGDAVNIKSSEIEDMKQVINLISEKLLRYKAKELFNEIVGNNNEYIRKRKELEKEIKELDIKYGVIND